MDLAWNIHRWGPDNIEDFLVEWTGQQFGRQHGGEIAAIRTEFYRLAAERRADTRQGREARDAPTA
ncbi:Glycosyl hydrolase family 115 [Lentzea albidocapillata]|uniref:Glycosyl hydrolase family 115 n=2 Tax=Lentzea albidocapillata TaxID=40571 RepID=A0A1W2F902_9PSEU|nr:Glycosyl hydrolase family 115 [Lentzea albidocapillata]